MRQRREAQIAYTYYNKQAISMQGDDQINLLGWQVYQTTKRVRRLQELKEFELSWLRFVMPFPPSDKAFSVARPIQTRESTRSLESSTTVIAV